MIYELIIENNKEKSVIGFLKQLDFVKIRKVQKNTRPKKVQPIQDDELPYFGADVNWDIDAAELRKKGVKKRLTEW